MQSLKFILLLAVLGTWSCTPKIAKNIEDKSDIDGSEIIEATVKLVHPPIAMDGGIQMNYLYAGIPNEITIHVEGGNTAHLIVGATNGTLSPSDVTKGRYNFFSKKSGLAVEIYAKDTSNNITLAEMYEVVPMPAPNAFAWAYGKPLPGNDALNMDAMTFRAQNALVLRHDFRVPVLCAPNTFKITRINIKGQRESHTNKQKTGEFDAKTIALVQAAQPGDIFVFENIESPCTSENIKNIVYTLE
jgi:hypothetical protein